MTEGDAALDQKVDNLILEYAQNRPAGGPSLDGALTLRGDLAVDSLALVSLTIRLGEELGVDVVESGLDFSTMQTVADLRGIARQLRGPR